MATVHKVRDIRASSRNGVVTRLERKVLVSGLTDTDEDLLTSALTECNTDFAVGSTPGSPYPANLILTERNPSAVPDREGVVDVDLVYETSTRSQSVTGLAFGGLIPEISTSVASLESNRDSNGDEVTLTHVYPTSDENYGTLSLARRTKTQPGRFSYQEAQPELHVRFIRSTNFPRNLTDAMAGAVNEVSWQGGSAREWMCVRADARPLSLTDNPASFEFSFTFARNRDGWDPEVIFIDAFTNEPPVGVIDGVGYKRIQKHRAIDFEETLGARVLGG